MVLKSCQAKTCREPWTSLHPSGEIRSLKQALHPKFDDFYDKQPKIAFKSCQLGYLIDEEGPQNVDVWDELALARYAQQQTFQYTGHWSLWT